MIQHDNSAAPTLIAKLRRYRWLIRELVIRDLKLRYRGSVLGFAWTLLNPLLFMGVYTFVFGVIMRNTMHDYSIFLLCGLLPWTWFSSSLTQGTTAILDGRMYVGKTVFPAEVLVLVPLLSNFVNLVLSLPFFLAAILIFHGPLGWPLLFLPIIIAIQMMLTLGLMFFFATVNVFYRDLQQLVSYVVTLLFFLTPILYSVAVAQARIPMFLRPIFLANPLAVLVIDYQKVLFFNTFPELSTLVAVAFGAAVVLASGYAFFDKYKESMGEYL